MKNFQETKFQLSDSLKAQLAAAHSKCSNPKTFNNLLLIKKTSFFATGLGFPSANHVLWKLLTVC